MMTMLCLVAVGCAKQDPQALLTSARSYCDKKDYNACIIQLRSALQQEPKLGDALQLLGHALIETKDPTAAAIALRRALDSGQSPDAVLPLLARAMVEGGEFEKFINEFADRRLNGAEASASFDVSLGKAYLVLRRARQSEAAYAAALRAKPGFVPARLGQAELAVFRGDWTGALALLDEIIESSPADADALFLLAGVLTLQDNRVGAIEALKMAVREQGGHLFARRALIDLLIEDRQFEQAATVHMATPGLRTADAYAGLVESQLDFEKGNVQRARDRIQEVVAASPNYANALALAGAIDLHAGNRELGELHLRKALSIAPKVFDVRARAVNAYLRGGHPNKALATLQPLLTTEAMRYLRYQMLAGEAYLAHGDMSIAASHFARAAGQDVFSGATEIGGTRTASASISPMGPSWRIETAKAQRERRYALAIEAVQRTKRAAPGDESVAAEMIEAQVRGGRLAEALRLARDLQRSAPSASRGFALEGAVHVAQRQWPEAARALRQAVRLAPNSGRQAQELHVALVGGNRSAEADSFARAWLAEHPSDVEFRMYLINAALAQRDFKAAVALGQSVVATEPNHAPALHTLATASAKLGRIDATTIGWAEKAVKLAPDQTEYLGTLGMLRVQAGQAAEGERTLAKALASDPFDPGIRLMHAKALRSVGRRQDAEAELVALSSLSEPADVVSEARQLQSPR
jgi:tetratricopeptide (TPR) repeat protein